MGKRTEFIRAIVRPLLAVMGFMVLSIGFLQGKVPLEAYVPMVGMMVAFWFASRTHSSGQGGPNG